MTHPAVGRAVHLFRLDAARWVRPQEIADPAEVTPALAARLLYQHPPLRAMAWFRLAQLSRELGIRGMPGYVQRMLIRRFGLEIAPSTPVDGGLYIAHPVGCVLHAEAIGANVTVVGQVTFGTRNDARWPVIGDGAFIGVGARVLGGLEVGAGARIGANAVVIDDVPDGATVAGIPARIVGQSATGGRQA